MVRKQPSLLPGRKVRGRRSFQKGGESGRKSSPTSKEKVSRKAMSFSLTKGGGEFARSIHLPVEKKKGGRLSQEKRGRKRAATILRKKVVKPTREISILKKKKKKKRGGGGGGRRSLIEKNEGESTTSLRTGGVQVLETISLSQVLLNTNKKWRGKYALGITGGGDRYRKNSSRQVNTFINQPNSWARTRLVQR